MGQKNISLKIYDVNGKEVTNLAEGKFSPGEYEIKWMAGNNPSGVYFYKLNSANLSITKKMILIK